MEVDRDHLGLAIGESLCLQYVLHGKPVSDAAVLIGHHSEFAVLDEMPYDSYRLSAPSVY